MDRERETQAVWSPPSLSTGDIVTVPTQDVGWGKHQRGMHVTVTHVGRKYFEGINSRGEHVGKTGIGLVAGEHIMEKRPRPWKVDHFSQGA